MNKSILQSHGDRMIKNKPYVHLGDHGPLYRPNCNLRFSMNYNLVYHKLEVNAHFFITHIHIKCF